MTNVGGKVATTFRESFRIVQKDALRWFPGHMHKGLKKMQQKLKDVDCIIEVHDARVPISGRYADFSKTLTGLKPHILVLSKRDLADMRYKTSICDHLKTEGINNVIFANLKNQDCDGARKILPLAKQLINNSNRYNRMTTESFALMVIGVPNVGKSSLINRLRHTHIRKSRGTQVGGVAGITRSVLTRIKIAEDPDVYLVDTPGILAPNIKDTTTGLKLALAGCLQDHLVGHQILADFLLFWLNKHKRFEYVEKLGMKAPNDNITYVLTFIAAKLQKTLRVKDIGAGTKVVPDLVSSAMYFVDLFRKGELGYFCLDEDLLNSHESYIKEQLA